MGVEEIYKVEAVIELEVPKDIVDSTQELKSSLMNEFVKVKAGEYENIVFGYITAINSITSDTREWS